MGRDKYKFLLFLILVAIFSITVFKPVVEGDSFSYIQSIQVLKTGIVPTDFLPNRIITTFLGLYSIMGIDLILNNLLLSWLLLSTFFYVLMGIFFYSLLCRMLENHRTAFLGTLFLVTNYSAVVFSFHYLMDIEGWAFYIMSLYFSYRYLESRENKWLWISAATVGLGGLFKEYAFLAYIVLFGEIIFTEWKKWWVMGKKILITGAFAFTPLLLLNLYSLYEYDYTYISWFLFNQDYYKDQNKIVEYIKSFGSLYTFGWFIFAGGAVILLRRFKEILKDQKLLFTWLVILSSCVVFVWPVVTRVLFITVPAIVLVSTLFLKKIENRWYLVIPILILYIASSYFMDSFILNYVNLPF